LQPDGSFYNTIIDLTIGTGLHERAQRTAINNLKKLKLLQVQKRGIPAKRYFKINDDINLILKYIEKGTKKIEEMQEKPMNTTHSAVAGTCDNQEQEVVSAVSMINNTNPNNTDLNNKENIYMTLASHDNFISFYLKSHKDYLKKDHVRVTEEQLEFIDKSIDNLKVQDVTFEQWQEAVIEHFENLPKKNNGNILAFLKASYRYFEVMPLD